MAEQRYQAVVAVISDGETVTDVAARFGVVPERRMRRWARFSHCRPRRTGVARNINWKV